MSEENIRQEFRMKNIVKTRNFIKEVNQNELMSMKHEKASRVFNYIEQFLILITAVPGCVSNSSFPSLLGMSI